MPMCNRVAALSAAAICLAAALAAQAFDSAAWLEKRALLMREAERLHVAYSNCLARVQSPAEDVKIPLDTFADGSVKTMVSAKKAYLFSREGLVWAEGVEIRRFREDGTQESLVEAASCVVDRTTKSGWAEGPARVVQGKTSFRGEDVYFSSPEEYVRVFRNADLESDDMGAARGVTL